MALLTAPTISISSKQDPVYQLPRRQTGTAIQNAWDYFLTQAG